jgi:N-acetyl-gamma-glutamyl-phosphate/LysW-gamma-L-alpha-aminoadipyl-6-phosphate reductase
VQVACHITPSRPIAEPDVWALYRERYGKERFVRLVRERSARHRLPEPKILSGSNYCDIGLALSSDGDHLIVVAALDNLMKGGAGNAVQCANIASGWDEAAGLLFAGLHPA